MARRTKPPDTSKIIRTNTIAYARKHKGEGDATEPADPKPDEVKPSAPVVVPAAAATATTAPPIVQPSGETPKPPDAAPAPSADPEPPGRARTITASMPAVTDMGAPPDVPTTTAAPRTATGEVEDPTHMPGPREIPGGTPTDPTAPPGHVPPGDSRSLRRGGDFALVYRMATFVISRFGAVGTRGQWRVVEYPTSAAASHSYAKECSRFVAEGFSDYRG